MSIIKTPNFWSSFSDRDSFSTIFMNITIFSNFCFISTLLLSNVSLIAKFCKNEGIRVGRLNGGLIIQGGKRGGMLMVWYNIGDNNVVMIDYLYNQTVAIFLIVINAISFLALLFVISIYLIRWKRITSFPMRLVTSSPFSPSTSVFPAQFKTSTFWYIHQRLCNRTK